MKCGGTFSDAEFESLEAKKTSLLQKKVEARARLTSLAWELLAVQKEHDVLDQKLDKVRTRQNEMVDQEARAVEELDNATEENPQAQLALMSDGLFSWDDLDGPLLHGFVDTSGPTLE